ncbi:hypothetical protein [Acidocella sp.]|uniref:hypothetical protein n=1 Tax=Acidocella sp. TaxID=50710 RepID=UPI00260266E8|nr:hypothetical protein [Acidocella sp.]MDD2794392.1 hypothetical protein [Acidocella sp.]
MNSPLINTTPEHWTATGIFSFRRGLFGGAVLYIEEIKSEFRPKFSGHTPANWILAHRWRRAKLHEARSIHSRKTAPFFHHKIQEMVPRMSTQILPEALFYAALIDAKICPQTLEELRSVVPGSCMRRKLDAVLAAHNHLVAQAVKAARIEALREASEIVGMPLPERIAAFQRLIDKEEAK